MTANFVPPARSVRRVLAVTNGWPTELHPEYCVFTKRQIDDLRAIGLEVEVEFVNARDKGRIEYLRSLPGLARRAETFDLVHCFHGLSFLLARLGRVRRPVVVSFLNALEHEYADLPALLRPVAETITSRLLRTGRYGIIFKDRLPDWLAAEPLARHLPNGVALDGFTPGDKLEARRSLGLPPAALCLLFVSSKNLLRPQKRYDRFLAVLEAMRARSGGREVVPLTLVAETPDRVRLAYRAADVHVMTSAFEGSPNSVKEAMASALPVVSTDVGNVRAMTEGLAAARVVDPFGPEAFCDAIEVVTTAGRDAELALREALRARGLDAADVAARIVALYEDTAKVAAR